MIGDVYLAAALAIFIGIFGWSERIFGLSKDTKEREANYIQKAGFTLSNYLELKKVIATNKLDSVAKTKKINALIKDTKIKPGDKKIFDKLKENEGIFCNLNGWNYHKKVFFIILFLFLFLIGSILIVIEATIFNMEYYSLIILISQVILFFLCIYGGVIYMKINKYEKEVQDKLNELILMET